MGDNRDTYYPMNGAHLYSSIVCEKIPIICNKLASTSLLSDSVDDYMVVAGVDHTMTGRVRYTSIAVLGKDHLNSVGGAHD